MISIIFPFDVGCWIKHSRAFKASALGF